MKQNKSRSRKTMAKRNTGLHVGIILVLLLSASLMAACGPGEAQTEPLPDIKTELLVRAPDTPLPVNRTIEVKSRTEAADGVSHVDLYVTLPGGEKVLVYSDAAQFQQKTFIVSQIFTPRAVGHYSIEVIGYNHQAQPFSSNIISFDVQ
jgi:hypothetical protein